jgi:hypothetical protein
LLRRAQDRPLHDLERDREREDREPGEDPDAYRVARRPCEPELGRAGAKEATPEDEREDRDRDVLEHRRQQQLARVDALGGQRHAEKAENSDLQRRAGEDRDEPDRAASEGAPARRWRRRGSF